MDLDLDLVWDLDLDLDLDLGLDLNLDFYLDLHLELELGELSWGLGAGSWELSSGNRWEGHRGNRAGPPAVPGIKILNTNPLEIHEGIPS